MATLSLKSYEEMNPREIAVHWPRLDIKSPGGLSVFKSPNKALWAFVDERRCVTVVMWNVHTGRVYKEEKPEPVDPACVDPGCPGASMGECMACKSETRRRWGLPAVCANCGHDIRWSRVAVPPRWEHVRAGFAGGMNWICGCGCMEAKPKEAGP